MGLNDVFTRIGQAELAKGQAMQSMFGGPVNNSFSQQVAKDQSQLSDNGAKSEYAQADPVTGTKTNSGWGSVADTQNIGKLLPEVYGAYFSQAELPYENFVDFQYGATPEQFRDWMAFANDPANAKGVKWYTDNLVSDDAAFDEWWNGEGVTQVENRDDLYGDRELMEQVYGGLMREGELADMLSFVGDQYELGAFAGGENYDEITDIFSNPGDVENLDVGDAVAQQLALMQYAAPGEDTGLSKVTGDELLNLVNDLSSTATPELGNANFLFANTEDTESPNMLETAEWTGDDYMQGLSEENPDWDYSALNPEFLDDTGLYNESWQSILMDALGEGEALRYDRAVPEPDMMMNDYTESDSGRYAIDPTTYELIYTPKKNPPSKVGGHQTSEYAGR